MVINGLYVTYEYSVKSKDVSSGIAKKIYAQKECFEKIPAKIDFYNPYEENMKRKFFRVCRRIPLYGYFNKIVSHIDFNKIDFVYIRKPWLMDADTLLWLRKIKKVNQKIKILMEVPTYPYDYEMETISMLPLLVKDKLYRGYLKEYVDRIITYSNDDYIWGIKTIPISNGVNLDEEMIIDSNKSMQDINIVAVSNLAFWHGYDRAINGLYNYYLEGGKENIILHIVGTGKELEKLIALTKKCNLCDNVVFYGRKNKTELMEIYKRCRIGLDSLGRHRSHVSFNSSLKSKEYLMKGLLIVSGVGNELDLEIDYPYYMRVSSNDTPIDFKKILEFYHSIYDRSDEYEIRKEIISFGKKKFSMDEVMKPVIDYIKCDLTVEQK